MCFACALIMCLNNHGYHYVYHAEHWCLYTSRSRASGTIVPKVPRPPKKKHTLVFFQIEVYLVYSIIFLHRYLNYIFTNTYFPLLNFCQICRCNMVSCGFHLCPLECLRVWESFFFMLIAICVFSPVKGLLMPFAHFGGNCFFLKYFLDLYAFRIGIVYEYYICNI